MAVSYVQPRVRAPRRVGPRFGSAVDWPAWTDEVSVTVCRGRIEPRGRNWAVYDERGELVCICVYKRGALEVLHRLTPRA
jgi:hypothetical protein